MGETSAEKRKRMYDLAMEQYQMLMETPAMWENDPDMKTPDGKFNLCLDCINVDWSNPDDIMDAHRLIEEGYSTGTHYAEKEFHDGLKALGVPAPVYNSKPAVKPVIPQKASGGMHYGAYAPPMFTSGGMPCYECGGMYAEGGDAPCPQGTVPDGKGNCVSDLSTPPTPESSLFQYYQDVLSKPGMTEQIARNMIKSKRTCKPGDECWEEPTPTPVPVASDSGYYIMHAPEYGNPGVAYLYKKDPQNGKNIMGSVLAEDWLQGQELEDFINNGTLRSVQYDPNKRVWNNGYEPHKILEDRLLHNARQGADERRRQAMEEVERQRQMMQENSARRRPTLPQEAFGGTHFDIPFEEYAEGGGIPERYKNMGFTHVGQKKEGDGQHKWKVLAKKGDQYKVVQGGYRGMQDFKQHHSEERRERFWDRMGGRDSAKAKDPFSPLYWHKRFGTWETGGELPEMQDAGTTPPRSFWDAMSNFIPVYETYQDYSDVFNGARNGDKEQMNRGIVGLGQPVSGKGLNAMLDYVTEKTLGKQAADTNAKKRNDIINMSSADLQKLYIKYGPGGYDKWVADGMPKLQDGGEDYSSMIQAGDHTLDVTHKHQLNNLDMNNWNKGLAITNSLVDPRSPIHMLPDKGFGSGLKAIAGLAAGLSGATLGYEKMFAKDKTENYITNPYTNEAGTRQDVLKARYDKSPQMKVPSQVYTQDAQPSSTSAIPFGLTPEFLKQVGNMKPVSNMTPTGGSGMGAMEQSNNYSNDQSAQTQQPATNPAMPAIPTGLNNFMRGIQMKRNGGLTRYFPGGPFPQNNQGSNFVEQMLNQQSGRTGVGVGDDMQQGSYAAFNMQGTGQENKPQWQQDWQTTERGDSAGVMAANNALIGLGMANSVLGQKQLQKQYNRELMKMGNTDAMYNAVNPSNPYGNYTTNVGVGPNFALVRQTAAQDFSDANLARYGGTMKKKFREGGSYMVSDRELMEILANGGDVEFL